MNPPPAAPPAAPAAGRSPPPPGGAPRLPWLDAARGLAIVQMVAFHFLYDLAHFGVLQADFYGDPRWTMWRGAIVSQFLFVMGIGLALREGAGAPPARFWRRWRQIAACALLVSAATAVVFGARWIWFGVLHFAALSQLLARGLRAPAARLGAGGAVALGLALLLAGNALRLPAFSADSLSWIGFSPVKPATEDFVPLLPWLGVVLLGMGAARLGVRSRGAGSRQGVAAPSGAARADGTAAAPVRMLAAVGRWPLTIYMSHQPLLFGAVWLLSGATAG